MEAFWPGLVSSFNAGSSILNAASPAAKMPLPGILFWSVLKRVKELEKCSAFTIAELGEMLPARPEYAREEQAIYRLAMERQDTQWNIVFICADSGGCDFEPMLADTRAKVLIYLIESRLNSSKALAPAA